MSWRRAVGFVLGALAVLLFMRSSCHAPGYDVRRHVPRPFRHKGWKRPAAPAGIASHSAPASSAPVLAQLDEDELDSTRAEGTWAPPLAAAVPGPCPAEMVLAEGEYCPDAEQVCLQWIDEGSSFLPNHRCAKFREPSRCLSKETTFMRFCIDRDEHGDPSTGLPLGDQSWTMAKQLCEAEGRRLCNEQEWVFACEGPEMLPYPTGYVRDASLCNFDQTDLTDSKGQLRDLRKPSSALAGCASPFGARNMVGNVDEWVVREGVVYPPFRSALKGGWWMAARNRCRPATTAHDEHYRDKQTGFRCCRDADEAS